MLSEFLPSEEAEQFNDANTNSTNDSDSTHHNHKYVTVCMDNVMLMSYI